MAKTTVTIKKDLEITDIVAVVKVAEVSMYNVSITKATSTVDVKSILGLLSLGLRRGDVIVLESTDPNVLTQLANFL